MADDFRAAASTITKTALNASRDYVMLLWPLQPDQDDKSKIWRPPSDGSEFPEPGRVTRVMNGHSSGDGYIKFAWIWAFMTYGQVRFIKTYFGFTYSVLSVACTVQTLTSDFEWKAYTAIAHSPIIRESYEVRYPGMFNVCLRFTNAVEIS